MDKRSGFPTLTLPFALVGGAAGWLSAVFLANPRIGVFLPRTGEVATAVLAALFGAIAGAVLRRLCNRQRKRYAYELDELAPKARSATISWLLATAVVLAAGAVTGVAVAAFEGSGRAYFLSAFVGGGALCALAFLPMCLAVIHASLLGIPRITWPNDPSSRDQWRIRGAPSGRYVNSRKVGPTALAVVASHAKGTPPR